MDIYFFNYYFRGPLSLVFCFPLKAGPTLTAVSVWSALGQGSLHEDRDALHVSKLSASKLGGWLVGNFARVWLYQQTLKAVMALWLVQCPLLFPSILTSAALTPPASELACHGRVVPVQ